MLDEKDWILDREKSLTKRRNSQILVTIASILILGLFYSYQYLNIDQYFENYTYIPKIFWVIVMVVFLLKIPSYSNITLSNSDKIIYHLYSIAINLENLNELNTNTAKKEIQKHLKALDGILRNNDLIDDLFTKNILLMMENLLDSMERLNNYMTQGKKPKEANKHVAFCLRLIADNMRADNIRITDELSNSIRQLNSTLEKIKPLKIIIPTDKKIYDGTIRYWEELPKSLKISILSILVILCIFLIPKNLNVEINNETKSLISLPLILFIANHYLYKKK